MSTAYWKFIGEKITNGVGAKTIQRLGTGGKFLGQFGGRDLQAQGLLIQEGTGTGGAGAVHG